MNTRVKVPRTLLIERIEAAIKEETEEHEAAAEKYKKELVGLKDKLQKELEGTMLTVSSFSDEELIDFAKEHMLAGKVYGRPDKYRSSLLLTTKIPERPRELNLEHLERDKRILEASTDETISVSWRDSYYQYI